ncbi:hypothetical protein MNEG_10542 [Monoraphidium neglectum]|uniref:PhoD-like phosphatase domain-containing protein n=1 Tax=Monoraphidium neglectum TaxID=145388 RepID=A0A0D2M8L3_9CHLO|nr:hypothetical protein MNEG_10542 [Monoraphidium neglectum]KIY97421.1 hypothetical protein MNEG_10542 [Monoraphidium neglectum]|eukprot:XP_013896441.1 hypothetical protein MNEG_10542 [Monoraphidium neglectum]
MGSLGQDNGHGPPVIPPAHNGAAYVVSSTKGAGITTSPSGRRFVLEDDAPYPAPIAAGEEERVSRRAKQPNTCGCGDLAARDSIGPLLRFAGYDPDEDCWMGSVLYVCKPSVTLKPVLTWTDTDAGTSHTVPANCLDSFCEWNFWRFDLGVPVGDGEKRIEYSVQGEGGAFYVAGREQSYHWGYYSCNGFTPDVPREEGEKKWCGLEPLWRDVLARHKDLPLHVMVGGGDQLYNDDVLKSPALQPFLDAPTPDRPGWEFGADMRDDPGAVAPSAC